MSMTQELFHWLEQHQIQLRARHIAGKLNVLADSLSREGKVIPTEWSLHPGVLTDLWTIWERPHVDLFATRFNAKMSSYYSPFPDPQAVGVDALSTTWEAMVAYAFPPTAILGRVLAKAEREQCVLVLVAPMWPKQPWYPHLLDLLVDYPIRLP